MNKKLKPCFHTNTTIEQIRDEYDYHEICLDCNKSL